MFSPKVLTPEPDKSWLRELRRIDPDLRIVWGSERYLRSRWIIERKVDPERYFRMYSNLLEADSPRFIEQPIYDSDKPILNEEGEVTGYELVGVRQYDLAPEYEYVKAVETPTGEFRPFGEVDILELKRSYAWHKNHPLSRSRYEEEERLAKESKERAEKNAEEAAIIEGIDEGYSVTGWRKRFAQPREIVLEGTEI